MRRNKLSTVAGYSVVKLSERQPLFTSISDEHAEKKELNNRDKNTHHILYKITKRYKLFKTVVTTKCPEL